jgi:hypothetical protein
MLDKSVEELCIIPNKRFSIKSRDGIFRKFKGLLVGVSEDMYEWNGMKCTGDHLVGINPDEYHAIKNFQEAKKINDSHEVFDFLDVEETNDYLAKGPDESSIEVLNHNCQTGDQFINILDTKLDKYIKVTFEELENMIVLDNLGLDYESSKVIQI